MRRLLAVSLVLVGLTAALLAGPAAAGSSGSNRPVGSFDAGTPAGAGVTVTATVNRRINQIASCLYGVDAAASIDCGAGTPNDSSTTFTVSLDDQDVGEHTVNVKIT